jgi:hypothetical protein
MRRVAASVVLASALIAGSTSSAVADAPKFHSATSDVSSTGALVASFDERGLGNGDVTYSLTAQADAVYACINGGNKNPSAANKRAVSGAVESGGTFSPRNGRISATLFAGPPGPGTFECPNGQRLRLLSVTYTSIVLTDVTNDVSVNLPDASGP